MTKKAFYDSIRHSLFRGSLSQDQVNGIDTIIGACRRENLSVPEMAYVLATAYHETGRRMMPVREAFGRSDAESYAKVSRWLRKKRRKNYAAIDSKTGQSYYGRGYVQLTHRENYARAGEKTGADFENQPDSVMNPWAASLILVRGMKEGWFTGMKLGDFDLPKEYKQARQIVNRMDKAATIAGYAKKFQTALDAIGVIGS